MRLTDDRILSVLKETLGSEPGKMTLQQIADKAGCHRDTAYRSVKRLKSAGRLKAEWQDFSKPCIYQVLE